MKYRAQFFVRFHDEERTFTGLASSPAVALARAARKMAEEPGNVFCSRGGIYTSVIVRVEPAGAA